MHSSLTATTNDDKTRIRFSNNLYSKKHSVIETHTNKFMLNIYCVLVLCVFVCFCTGRYVMVSLNLTCLHCLQHYYFEHLFNLYHCDFPLARIEPSPSRLPVERVNHYNKASLTFIANWTLKPDLLILHILLFFFFAVA